MRFGGEMIKYVVLLIAIARAIAADPIFYASSTFLCIINNHLVFAA